uniref:AEC family transporter n=1 Tax=Aliarcobacter sp. TaxID=2321116 RepID=UPI004047BF61
MDNFVLIAIAIIVGYALQKFKIFAKETPLILNQFIIYVSLPAIILMQVPKLTFSFDIIIPTIVAWLVMGISALIVVLISKILKWTNEVTGSLMLVAILTNSSIMGIPIINAYLGEEALPYVLIYDQLGTFIALATYGTFVTAYYSTNSSISSRVILQKVLTFPPFLSLIIALCFLGVEFNPLVTNVLSNFAATLVPVALVAVGLQLQFKVPKDEIQPLTIALIIKLVLAPIIAYLVCYSFDWLNLAGKVSIFEAGMAPMITAGAIASIAGLAPRLSTAIVGYGIIISFLTTAILFKIIG